MIRIPSFDLSSRNTFGMKVSCAMYIEYTSVEELKSILAEALPQPVFHIGGGSNLLFRGDFPGTVLHSAITGIDFHDDGDEVIAEVGAGVVFDDFVAESCRRGLWGVENLSLIPGEAGASAVQNIGAYGVEAGDVIDKVFCIEASSGKEVVFRASECAYGYRDSRFKHEKGRYIVTRVTFRLTRRYCPSLGYGNIKAALEGRDLEALTPLDVRDAIIRIRREKLPDPAEIGSAGSFFKNPVISKEHFDRILASVPDGKVPHFDLPDGTVKVPAAWMIDTCGFRGAVRGGAKVFEKQPLVIVNDSGSASPEDIIALEDEVIAAVRDRFGVILHPEVEHI
ncbi:MAG: UDP-N-acetylmuramate dehydrogenase [Bacteroidales bacterium]|nr:UDP-N-acetylmuramate dehydrogenase [Bacteroidales bacterium]